MCIGFSGRGFSVRKSKLSLYVGFALNDKVYNNVYVRVMENLCCNVLLGEDLTGASPIRV